MACDIIRLLIEMQDLFSRACDGRNIPVHPQGLHICVSHGVSFMYINMWFIIRRFFVMKHVSQDVCRIFPGYGL